MSLVKESNIEVDEKTKRALRIIEEVKRVAAALPPEEQPFNVRAITFDAEHAAGGWDAAFFGGTVIASGREGVALVPERTLKILNALNIPYRIVPKDRPTEGARDGA